MGEYIRAELARIEVERTLEANRWTPTCPTPLLTEEDIERLLLTAPSTWRGRYGLLAADRYQR